MGLVMGWPNATPVTCWMSGACERLFNSMAAEEVTDDREDASELLLTQGFRLRAGDLSHVCEEITVLLTVDKGKNSL